VIRFLEGRLIEKNEKGVVVFVGRTEKNEQGVAVPVDGIGYEVEVGATTRRLLPGKEEEKAVLLHVSYQQSANQPVPRLYGFLKQLERDFFEELLRVDKVGPSIALAAMSVPVNQVAKAIVDRDVKTLSSIKGVAKKTAEKIIAELNNRVAKYALLPDEAAGLPEEVPDFRAEVKETLTKQLGFKPQEAQRLIDEAMKQNSAVSSAEELFDEVLKAHK
jgi:Holliday junction DNA helicase RuvA